MNTTSTRSDNPTLACCGASLAARYERPDLARTVLGGFVGSVVMTAMMYFVAPMMLGQPMDIAKMLGSMLGHNWWAGMVMHFANGVVLFPLIYALVLFGALPGTPALKGSLWGAVLWVLAQAVVMPMMGAGFFSANAGGVVAAMSSLMGHLVYGCLLGWIAGKPR